MQLDLTDQEKELLVAIFNSSLQIPTSHVEFAASIKAKLAVKEQPRK